MTGEKACSFGRQKAKAATVNALKGPSNHSRETVAPLPNLAILPERSQGHCASGQSHIFFNSAQLFSFILLARYSIAVALPAVDISSIAWLIERATPTRLRESAFLLGLFASRLSSTSLRLVLLLSPIDTCLAIFHSISEPSGIEPTTALDRRLN